MNLFTIVVIAVGLAMDAFAVSVASGFVIRRLQIRHALRIAIFFGAFQALMPVVGWLAGLSLRDWFGRVDHWIAFGLLCFIGIKMMVESFRLDGNQKKADPMKLAVLLLLSIATSIDALAVGLTFAILKVSIFVPVVLIGLITFLLSFTGVYIGDHFGHFFEKKIEFIGGMILIGIGTKILIEHIA